MEYPFYLAENLTAMASSGNLKGFSDLVERNFNAIVNTRAQVATVKWLRVVQLQANIARALLRAGGKQRDLYELSQGFLERICKVPVGDRQALKFAILEFAQAAFKTLPGPLQNRSELVKRFFAFLGQSPLKSINVKNLALKLDVSASHLCREVRRETGQPPKDHVRKVKLEWAKIELDKMSSITEIAMAAGFGKASTFIAVFRKEFGETPGTYKRRTAGRKRTRELDPAGD